ncbi:MAG TPA: peroxidase family protein [Actinomycetota bacterium]|nr:peroxidase family protein [Actinomycetota bacterium]
MARSLVSRAVGGLGGWLDRRYGWDKLPLPLGLVSIAGLRATLRAENLVDTNTPGHPPAPTHAPPQQLEARSPDGTYNDLQNPQMGAAAARFGRNVPLAAAVPEAEPDLLEPNVRLVSRELLTRESFQPATIINLLVAAWLQFMVHDWMSHGPNEQANPFLVPVDDADPWDHDRPMPIQRTRADTTRTGADASLPPTFTNTETHWWDASQLYGTDPPPELVDLLRTREDGKVKLDQNHLIPFDPSSFDGKGVDVAGVSGNWWLGLGILHSLFMQEHNAVCDALRATYPSWTDDQLFARARLIVSGLLAKIHTVEWTPAIITHPTSQKAMHINWYGAVPAWMRTLLLPLHNEVLTGIPGSKKDHDGAPYCLTEEFVAVYRMHPLIPDEFTFRSAATGEVILEKTFRDIAGTQARATLEGVPMEDLLYSFGVGNAGAVRLHNFPKFLQEFTKPDGSVIDLAATDILRSRERGVPRYNEFRRLLHMKPYTSFSALCGGDAALAKQVEDVYEGRIDRVDTSVGMFAEPLPKGFGFSDTAFRIFILMASRRLRSDRFFTTDFTPQVYTPLGMRWIQQTTMRDVIRRHYPSLASLVNPDNAFTPWAPISPKAAPKPPPA